MQSVYNSICLLRKYEKNLNDYHKATVNRTLTGASKEAATG